jgi:hypothetical protein
VVVEKFQSDVELKNMIEKWLWQSHMQRRVNSFEIPDILFYFWSGWWHILQWCYIGLFEDGPDDFLSSLNPTQFPAGMLEVLEFVARV